MWQVPCEARKWTCTEVLVDMGVQSSVTLCTLAWRINLTSLPDRSHHGVAAGVDTTHMMGKLRNVAVKMFHNAELIMDFIVLDVKYEQNECIVDLQRDMLMFGSVGVVQFSLLPADQSHVNIRNSSGQLWFSVMWNKTNH